MNLNKLIYSVNLSKNLMVWKKVATYLSVNFITVNCKSDIFFCIIQDKPVVIPDRLKEKKMPHVPEFVRNVMGSSAGAGSGEFHVYRHLRRKEYARQKFIQEKSEKVSIILKLCLLQFCQIFVLSILRGSNPGLP